MSIMLAELPLARIVETLQAWLPSELASIDEDRDDGITMAAPADADYYKRPKSEIAGSTVHVEVYETAWEFTDPYTDVDNSRAVYDMEIIVRCTFFNRNGDSADTMITRMRRYGAALEGVFLMHPTLTGADDAIQVVTVSRGEPYWENEGEDADMVRCVSSMVTVTAKCEEVWS